MRRIFFILLGVSTLSFLSAQDYTPFPTNNATWHNMHISIQPNGNELTEHFFTIEGTYEANGHTYNSFYCNGWLIGGMREDSLKTVWYHILQDGCGPNYPEINNDSLEVPLYEFGNIEIGSQFDYLESGFPSIVTAIDSVLINDAYRKYYKVEEGLIGVQYWIEGIGSTSGLFANYATNFEWEDVLLCYSDSTTNYVDQFLGYNSCDASLYQSVNTSINVYPNPVLEEVRVESKHVFDRFSILNTSGELIATGVPSDKEFQFDSKDWAPGTYFLKLVSSNSSIVKKLIKL